MAPIFLLLLALLTAGDGAEPSSARQLQFASRPPPAPPPLLPTGCVTELVINGGFETGFPPPSELVASSPEMSFYVRLRPFSLSVGRRHLAAYAGGGVRARRMARKGRGAAGAAPAWHASRSPRLPPPLPRCPKRR